MAFGSQERTGTDRASVAREATPPAVKLSVRQLRKTFGPFVALEGASFDIREGEFLTLLGPSGSGKTTLLLAIAGLNEPDGGEVWIDGDLATYLPPYKRDIGMVFQNYALFPHMTVRENIAFPLRMRRVSDEQARRAVERVLDIVQLPHLAERYPRQLSGGQQQRIALARALIYEPSIVLMDEPLGALDKKLRDQLQFEIKRLHEELGLAVLYVTHDQQEALVMSDRICLMRDGRIEQLGTPDELYFRPASLFVADFLGESNLLPATLIERCGETAAARLGDGTIMRGICTQPLEAGAAVRVMVRPESIALLNAGEDRDNVLTASFRDRVMMGGTTKLFLGLPDGQELRVERLTQGPASTRPRYEDVRVGWSADRCVILAEE